MKLTTQIKNSIAELHHALESTSLARAMVAATITREQYQILLSQMLHIYECLESRVSLNPICSNLDIPAISRSSLIRNDLKVLGLSEISSYPETDSLLNLIEQQEIGLLGVLYVLEGSRMGSLILSKTIAQALAVPVRPGSGLDYHLAGASSRVADWQKFRDIIDNLELTLNQCQTIIDVAKQTMQYLLQIYQVIDSE